MLINGEIQDLAIGEYYGEYDSLREEFINYQKKSGEGNFLAFRLSFTCDYMEENERFLDMSKNPKIANIFSFEINERMFDDKVANSFQKRFTKLFKTVFSKLNGISGFITYETIGGSFGLSSTQYESGINEYFLKGSQKFDKNLRGYFWGNIITERHIEMLGGIEKIRTQSPCYRVDKIELLENKALYLQLTEDINDYADDNLRLLRKFLQPVLPQGPKILDYDPYNMKDEPYKNGFVSRLLEEDYCNTTNDENVYIEYLKLRDGK